MIPPGSETAKVGNEANQFVDALLRQKDFDVDAVTAYMLTLGRGRNRADVEQRVRERADILLAKVSHGRSDSSQKHPGEADPSADTDVYQTTRLSGLAGLPDSQGSQDSQDLHDSKNLKECARSSSTLGGDARANEDQVHPAVEAQRYQAQETSARGENGTTFVNNLGEQEEAAPRPALSPPAVQKYTKPTKPKPPRKATPVNLAKDLAEELVQAGYHDALPPEVALPFLLVRRLKRLGGSILWTDLKDAAAAFVKGIAGEEFAVLDAAEMYAAALDVWSKVRFAENHDPLVWAMGQAKEHPVKDDGPFPSDEHALVAGTAYHLARYQRGKPVALPQLRLADQLGVTQRHVSRIIGFLVSRGLVTVANGGKYAVHKSAREYSWTGKTKLVP
jgi:hypothetical protein